MSREDIEIVRQGLVATSGGDPEGARAVFDPSIEWDMSGVPEWPEKNVYRGPEVWELLRMWADSWRDWHFDITDVRDAGGGRVLAGIHEWGTGSDSGVSVDQYRYLIFTVRAGWVARVQMFSNSAEALEAAGLQG